jgi:hypothetical protein
MNPIETILQRELRHVAAPAELRERVYHPAPRRAPILRWRVVFASIVAVATAWALHPRALSIQSENAAEIQAWVKARTGLNVPLSPAASLKLCGARVFGSSAEIQFRTGNRDATLVIAKADHAAPLHEFAGSNWTLRGQTYTSDTHAACLLCHEE